MVVVVVCLSVWFQEMDIGPPRLLFIPACSPQRWGLRFPTRRAESQGSLSEAVSRAQPAGAAACITTTGFYLVQGGGHADRVVEKRRARGVLWWSREKRRGKLKWKKMEKGMALVVVFPNVDLGRCRYIFVCLFVFKMVLRCDTQRNSKRESVRKWPKQENNILYLNYCYVENGINNSWV